MRRLVLCAVALAVAAPLAADYKDDYKDGFTAIERKEWADAEQAMRRAIAQNPRSGGKPVAIYGRRFEPYLPYFYLGLALYEQGDMKGAAEAWQQAEQQGEVRDNKDARKVFDDLYPKVKPLLVAETKPPDTTPTQTEQPPPEPPTPTGPSPQEIAAAASAASAAVTRAEQQQQALRGQDRLAEVLELNPGLGRDRDAADSKLAEAKRLLAAGQQGKDLEQIESASTAADQARQQYERLVPRVRDARQELVAAQREREAEEALREELVRDIGSLRREAQTALLGVSEVPRSTPELTMQERQVDRLVDQTASTDELDVAQLRRLEADLRSGIDDLATAIDEARSAPPPDEPGEAVPVPTTPPTSVVNAAKAYFSADYRKALSILGDLKFEDIRATVQANLFKAAAAFTLYRLEGQEGDRESAVAAVKQLRAVRPQFSPDPQVFSPSFIRFFERNG